MAECTCKTGCSDCLVKTYKQRRDTAEIMERTLNVSWTGGSHHNRVISANFPTCFTRAECNYYLQRFMTPTKEAFQGLGNGYADEGRQPKPGVVEEQNHIATKSGWREVGWVAMWPLKRDFEAPDDKDHETRIGLVTIERWDGGLRNTTQYPHPFIGTITVTLEGGDGAYYVQVVGASQEGQTPAVQSSDPKPVSGELAEVPGVSIWNGFAWVGQKIHPIDNTRNALNTWLGPVLFMNLSNIMIFHAFNEKRQLCGGVPVAYGAPKMPSTSSFQAMADALEGAAVSVGSDAKSAAGSIWSEIFGSKPAY